MLVYYMEYIYAALLLHRFKKEINEQNIKKIVEATGETPDEVKIKALISALSEVNIDEALKSATFTPTTTQPTSTTTTPETAKEKEKEKPAEEKKEEEALAGLSSLFG